MKLRRILFLLITVGLAASFTGAQQDRRSGASDPHVAQVRKVVEQAEQEIQAFERAGTKKSDPDHPVGKWVEGLWRLRASPSADAAGIAAAEAVHLLVHAERYAEVSQRADSLPPDDPAWERLSGYLLEAARTSKDYTYATRKFSEIIAKSGNPKSQAAAMLSLGNAQRHQNNPAGAEVTFNNLLRRFPEAPQAQQAQNLLYELVKLSPGNAAPEFRGTTRNAKEAALNDYRGKLLVLIFWAST